MVSVSFADYQRVSISICYWGLNVFPVNQSKVAPYAADGLLGKYFPDIAVKMTGLLTCLNTKPWRRYLNTSLQWLGSGIERKAGRTYSDFGHAHWQIIFQNGGEPPESRMVLLPLRSCLWMNLCSQSLISYPNKTIWPSRKSCILHCHIWSWELKSRPINTCRSRRLKEKVGQMLRINTGKIKMTFLESTALAAVAAAGLGLNEQNQLQSYVLDNSTTDILLYPEQLMFLKKALPRLSGAVSATPWRENKTSPWNRKRLHCWSRLKWRLWDLTA